jgi:hypothetical protein
MDFCTESGKCTHSKWRFKSFSLAHSLPQPRAGQTSFGTNCLFEVDHTCVGELGGGTLGTSATVLGGLATSIWYTDVPSLRRLLRLFIDTLSVSGIREAIMYIP